jgi:predicted alpha/beta hydrolase
MDLEIVAADGVRLAATLFAPVGPSRGTVLVHSATAVPQGYYGRFADFLARQGMRVLTYDYRGIGRSRPRNLRGFQASMTEWAELDARAAHEVVRKHWGHEPLALVGHSFGGQLLGLIDDVRDASCALLAATQLPSIEHFSLLMRAWMKASWGALLPALSATFGYVPGWAGLGEDMPTGAAEEWGKWLAHPAYLRGYHADASERFAKFTAPVLLYSFSDDDFAPPASVTAMAGALSGAELDHRKLTPELVGAPIGHFGFFRPQHVELWEEGAAWLRAGLEGKPFPERRVGLLLTQEDIDRGLGMR